MPHAPRYRASTNNSLLQTLPEQRFARSVCDLTAQFADVRFRLCGEHLMPLGDEHETRVAKPPHQSIAQWNQLPAPQRKRFA
jgi:hypothetical protein